MTTADMLLIAALCALVLAWWVRALPARAAVVLILALAVLGLAGWGVVDDRWQAAAGGFVALVWLLVLLVNRMRKAPARTGLPWVSGVLLAILALSAAGALVMFPVSPLPKPSGPNPVGVRSFEIVDATRPGVFAAKPGGPRRLLVRVWYPAGDVTGWVPRPYFTQAEADHTARTPGALVGFPPFFTYVKHVATNSFENAPLLPGARSLPVVIYSHGYTSFLAQNTVLMEELASHGYVVYSLQHTYDSSDTVFPNGDVAPADPKLFKLAADDASPIYKAQVQGLSGKTLDERLEGYLRHRDLSRREKARLLQSGGVWAADRIFLHDQLQAGAVPADVRPIVAAGDLTRVGEMGMSFGGATAGTVCMVDRRCAAGINLDGGDYPFQAFGRDEPVPFLMFHSDLSKLLEEVSGKGDASVRSFNEFSYESFDHAGTRADVYRMLLKDSRHPGLSDLPLFVRWPVSNPLFGSTPANVMIGAQNDFVRGFFDRHLRGQANGFPHAQLTAYEGWVSTVGGKAVHDWWAAKPAATRAAILQRIEAVRPESQP